MAKKGNKKPALGRGLGALLEAQQASQSRERSSAPSKSAGKGSAEDEAAVDMAGRVALLPISAILIALMADWSRFHLNFGPGGTRAAAPETAHDSKKD